MGLEGKLCACGIERNYATQTKKHLRRKAFSMEIVDSPLHIQLAREKRTFAPSEVFNRSVATDAPMEADGVLAGAAHLARKLASAA